jgi:hypothetical protein
MEETVSTTSLSLNHSATVSQVLIGVENSLRDKGITSLSHKEFRIKYRSLNTYM